ncbi:hypothetical protein KY290_027477 [Solanum tuberosum]|uniref:Uncharacterized protein n=1 Tax=Solanum tuberosum TaxID=4113 RepID=A0ABQ7UF59_SOLTU|nr:hypothetical protein KY285_026408 [Solanum tuberosum]KAH0748245.1 hypothetical protein KY290_027477 [Solanum tuberosum]
MERLQHTKTSHDSTVPIARSNEAISGKFVEKSPELRLQISPVSHQFHVILTNGDCSPGEEVHLTTISSKMDGPVTGDKNSGEQAVEKVKSDDGATQGNCSTEAEQQGTYSQYHAGPNGQTQDHNAMEEQKIEMELKQVATRTYQDQNDQHDNTGATSKIYHFNKQKPKQGEHSGRKKAGETLNPSSSRLIDRKVIHTISNQKSQQIKHPNQSKDLSSLNENQNTKQDQNIEPAPYTVVQTLAGKFSTTMPKIELIRKSFILETQLNGGVNIAHYNARHLFIDLENELDYNTDYHGTVFKKEFITPLLESVGKVLYLDTTTIKRTRASMAKEKHNEHIQEHNSKEEATTQGLQIRSKADHNKKTQVKQTGNKINNKSTCIDSMLPIPTNPNKSYLDDVVEVEGGMDGGYQEKQTNMQEGVSKGGNLTHVMHEGSHINHRSDSRTPATIGQLQSPNQ